MTSQQLSQIVYAQGFIERHFETHNNFLDDTESDDYREQVQACWALIGAGLDSLRKENTELLNKLTLVELAMKGQ